MFWSHPGAKFILKIHPNFAFKKISLKKWSKYPLFSFYFPIQNLLGILSWSLHKSCRELNSKQLSFLGHFQKMPFSCSKFNLKLLHFENLEKKLKKKKKNSSSPKWAGAPLSAQPRKTARAPACLLPAPARPAPALCARTRRARVPSRRWPRGRPPPAARGGGALAVPTGPAPSSRPPVRAPSAPFHFRSLACLLSPVSKSRA
jgi:hypothetical protein